MSAHRRLPLALPFPSHRRPNDDDDNDDDDDEEEEDELRYIKRCMQLGVPASFLHPCFSQTKKSPAWLLP